ncbi:MAG: hypothetical protein QW279_02700 [Candidatus Jordarchaeaceae archaeon]
MVATSLCLYPKCAHLNDDEGRTDLCGCHLQELLNIINRRKRENPNIYKGTSVHKLVERLTRTEILKLLSVDEEAIRKIVSKAKPPYDFTMIPLGSYKSEDERRNLKFKQFKGEHYNMVGGKTCAFCSVLFIYLDREGVLKMAMFRTRSKHSASELERRMFSVIVPRLKEIIFAQQEYPLDEWDRHVSYEGHYYHYIS